ncbi:hypothetical protein BU24DRAFT_215782 [Aaosphaeria arxii CBS 175.79]|uniref:Uncharacterized protein n=1 Tax=Aaosphaeria arxii CBS 175.79 TaxID=1450172 RepID=A0A6A5XMM8_9PLEO|nr:uncharacterized protein BU24DRAFT_215782 [Aaosphaeria arxii CBS 175.79]KAF2014498.1 hypothetical protein BU24DRAFT_215782 [Aaosphaeria arxii CBS 175.79]
MEDADRALESNRHWGDVGGSIDQAGLESRVSTRLRLDLSGSGNSSMQREELFWCWPGQILDFTGSERYGVLVHFRGGE